MIARSLVDYYRCPDEFANFSLPSALSQDAGFFRFDGGILCYGRSSHGRHSSTPDGDLRWALPDQSNGDVSLSFDPDEVVDNFRLERYATRYRTDVTPKPADRISTLIYYQLRPWLPVSIRKHLQRLRLRGWWKMPFPHWPVDTSVDDLLRRLAALAIASRGTPVPFIWFWPEGASACTIVTHDVETKKGVIFSSSLMDINEKFGMPASFQIVPEERYHVPREYLERIRQRNFEVNVHDLNHDGNLFRDRQTFDKRVARINAYAIEYNTGGFRSAVLYRNQTWYESLKFDYDMSVPNVGHLDPQRGGCCTVMPYFVGKILELPVTMTQDYSLFFILRDYSLRLWKQQINTILRHNGLISFIIHPDYLIDQSAQNTYRELLQVLTDLRRDKNVWIALPREVNRWWRQRHQMQIVKRRGYWQVEGPGSERAHLAIATCEDGQLVYRLCGKQLVCKD